MAIFITSRVRMVECEKGNRLFSRLPVVKSVRAPSRSHLALIHKHTHAPVVAPPEFRLMNAIRLCFSPGFVHLFVCACPALPFTVFTNAWSFTFFFVCLSSSHHQSIPFCVCISWSRCMLPIIFLVFFGSLSMFLCCIGLTDPCAFTPSCLSTGDPSSAWVGF